MEQTKEVYWTAEVAKEVGVSTTTINRWTHALEGLGYKIVQGTEGRAYYQKDIEILQMMKAESENGPKTKNVEIARKVLGLAPGEQYEPSIHEDVRYNQNKLSIKEQSELDKFLVETNKTMDRLQNKIEYLEGLLNERKEISLDEAKSNTDGLLNTGLDVINLRYQQELDGIEEERVLQVREEQMAFWTLQHQVEAELKKEAEMEWSKLPSSEREHRVFHGLFPKKVENQEKKKLFILDYINQRKITVVQERWNERQSLLEQKIKERKERIEKKYQQDVEELKLSLTQKQASFEKRLLESKVIEVIEPEIYFDPREKTKKEE